MEILGERVEELRSVRYSTKAGEQLRAEVGAYERAMAAAGRLLVDLARLGLDERQVRISEQQAALVNQVIRRVLAEVGLSPEQLEAARPVIGRHLRLAAERERERIALPVGAVRGEVLNARP